MFGGFPSRDFYAIRAYTVSLARIAAGQSPYPSTDSGPRIGVGGVAQW